jgi:hypothetical protein
MSAYSYFIEKLKALQLQGYPKQHIIDVALEGKNEVLIQLDKELIVAIMSEDKYVSRQLRWQMNEVNNLNKRIQKGLLE